MITGHFGLAWYARSRRIGAAGAAGTLPFLAMIAASVLPDGVDAILSAAVVCNRYGVYSHSLPAIALLAAAAFGISFAVWRDRRLSTALALLTLLHVPADWITGEKILWPGGPILRLYLYRWPWADFLLEAPIVWFAWRAYVKAAPSPSWAAHRASLVVLLVTQLAFAVAAPYTKRAGTDAHRKACGDQVDETTAANAARSTLQSAGRSPVSAS